MAGGDLLSGEAAGPRKRGRPKGSTNKRSKDLKGFIDARFGGSAAQQSAAMCMVTPAELKAAGGSMAKAQVGKALDLVEHVRRAQDGLDERLRQVVREVLKDLADELGEAKGRELQRLVTGAIGRIKEAGSGFGLAQALKLITDERAALMPYTDQKQPLAVEAVGDTWRPSVVVMGSPGAAPPMVATDVDFVEVFEGASDQVSPTKSHDEGQGVDLQGVLALPASD